MTLTHPKQVSASSSLAVSLFGARGLQPIISGRRSWHPPRVGAGQGVSGHIMACLAHGSIGQVHMRFRHGTIGHWRIESFLVALRMTGVHWVQCTTV